MKVVKKVAPPTGLRRRLWRLPIGLYRIGLGPLMGRRVMLLTHTGRVSGLPRHVVIEVVHPDEHGYAGPARMISNEMVDGWACVTIAAAAP